MTAIASGRSSRNTSEGRTTSTRSSAARVAALGSRLPDSIAEMSGCFTPERSANSRWVS